MCALGRGGVDMIFQFPTVLPPGSRAFIAACASGTDAGARALVVVEAGARLPLWWSNVMLFTKALTWRSKVLRAASA